MHEILVNRLGGLSLLRKSGVRLNDRPDMTIAVYCGRKNNNTELAVLVKVSLRDMPPQSMNRFLGLAL